jgi:hypothetical protein
VRNRFQTGCSQVRVKLLSIHLLYDRKLAVKALDCTWPWCVSVLGRFLVIRSCTAFICCSGLAAQTCVTLHYIMRGLVCFCTVVFRLLVLGCQVPMCSWNTGIKYDPHWNEDYWMTRPVTVFGRLMRIGATMLASECNLLCALLGMSEVGDSGTIW